MSRPVNTEIDVFMALSHAGRRRMVSMLAKGELSAGEIAGKFRMTQPAVAQHLRMLREAKVVSQRREGTRRMYRLNAAALKPVKAFLKQCGA